MINIVTRASKGAPLTNAEMDANLINLRDAIGTGGGTNFGFDSYSVQGGDLVVSNVSGLISSQSIVNGELHITVN